MPVQSLSELCSDPNKVCKELFSKGFVKLINKPIIPDLDGIMLKTEVKKIIFTESSLKELEKRYN